MKQQLPIRNRFWKVLDGPVGAAALAVMLLAPFLGKAYHMDDTLFLVVADQVRRHPLDPFGFEYNWFEHAEPMARVTQNPPLGGYLLALIRTVAGNGELAAHLCFLAIAAGCAILSHAIARRLCLHALLATALAIATPGFVVSATNVMADVPLLFFWLLAVWATLRAAGDDRPAQLWLAGLAASACVLTKYFGLAAVPLLALYWVLKTRRFTLHAIALTLPVWTLLAWGAYSQASYGVFHPLQAAQSSVEENTGWVVLARASATFVFLGGIAAWPLVLIAAWSKTVLAARIFLYAAVGLIFADAWFATDLLAPWSHLNVATMSLYGLMALTGLLVAAVGVISWRRLPDAESALLAAWLGGTLCFSVFFNWTVNARILLPALLPASLLTVRWIETLDSRRWMPSLWIASVVAAVLALAVAWADYEFAGAARRYAREVVRPRVAKHETVYFTGHLGFQYYAEAAGARPLDVLEPAARPGDLLAYPARNVQALVGGILSQRLREQSFPSALGLHVNNSQAAAGFYSSYTGPVPYNVAPGVPAEVFALDRILSIDKPSRPPGIRPAAQPDADPVGGRSLRSSSSRAP